MYIITNQKNVIIHISETIGYQNNGNVLVDNDTLAIAKMLVKQVYEVDEIPDDIVEYKYCYSDDKGFYKNSEYVEPRQDEEISKRLDNLENDVTNNQLAITDLYESMVK